MGQKEKLIERLKTKPKTFTFDDAESLLRYLGMSAPTRAVPAVPALCSYRNSIHRS